MVTIYRLLADAILLVHFAFVLFVVFGLVAVWVGFALGQRWCRNFWFRVMHLAAMGIVVGQALLGVTCPLTVWENDLRRLADDESAYTETFMEHWVHQVLFLDLEPSTFLVIYVVFFTALVASWIFVRPRWPSRARREEE